MYDYDSRPRTSKISKPKLGALIWAAGIMFALFLFFSTFENIKPGWVGVVYDRTQHENFGVLPDIKTGFTFINPVTQSIIEYPVATRTVSLTKHQEKKEVVDESMSLPTVEGQNLSADINFSYHVDPAKAPILYTKFRGLSIDVIEESFIRSNLRSTLQNVSGRYSVLDAYGSKRAEITHEAQGEAQAFFEESGIVLENLNFGDVRLPDSIANAVQAKINAIQAAETAIANQQKATTEAETARITAKGEADSQLIRAEAQATANEKVAASLNGPNGEKVVALKYIEAWGGGGAKVPYIMSGEGGNILQIPPLEELGKSKQ